MSLGPPSVAWLGLAWACSSGTGVDSGPSTAAEVAPVVLSAEADAVVGTVLTVRWHQAADGEATVEALLDDAWLAAPAVDRPAGEHEQRLLGLPFGTESRVRVRVGELASEEVSVSTAPRPERLPEVRVLPSEEEGWDPERPWLLLSLTALGASFGGPWWTVILDREGRAVWAWETPADYSTFYARVARDGSHLLLDHNSFWSQWDAAEDSRVVRLGLNGVVSETIETPGMSHAFVDLPDGSLAWMVHADGEHLLRRSPDGNTSRWWECEQFMAELGLTGACGTNALEYDAASDHLLISMFSSETVVELDAGSGEVVRWFGHAPGAWDFAPVGSTFWWQHGARFTDSGTLLLSTRVGQDVEETAVREYLLDEESSTLRQVWSFGEGQGLHAETHGEVHRLPGGNTLHNLGSLARLREISPEGTVVWDVQLGTGHTWLGRSEPLADLYGLLPEAAP